MYGIIPAIDTKKEFISSKQDAKRRPSLLPHRRTREKRKRWKLV